MTANYLRRIGAAVGYGTFLLVTVFYFGTRSTAQVRQDAVVRSCVISQFAENGFSVVAPKYDDVSQISGTHPEVPPVTVILSGNSKKLDIRIGDIGGRIHVTESQNLDPVERLSKAIARSCLQADTKPIARPS